MIIRFVCNLCGKVGQFSLQINNRALAPADGILVVSLLADEE